MLIQFAQDQPALDKDKTGENLAPKALRRNRAIVRHGGFAVESPSEFSRARKPGRRCPWSSGCSPPLCPAICRFNLYAQRPPWLVWPRASSRADGRLRRGSEVAVHDLAVGVDQEHAGQEDDPVVDGQPAFHTARLEDLRPGDLVLFQKSHQLGAIVVEIDADDLQARLSCAFRRA